MVNILELQGNISIPSRFLLSFYESLETSGSLISTGRVVAKLMFASILRVIRSPGGQGWNLFELVEDLVKKVEGQMLSQTPCTQLFGLGYWNHAKSWVYDWSSHHYRNWWIPALFDSAEQAYAHGFMRRSIPLMVLQIVLHTNIHVTCVCVCVCVCVYVCVCVATLWKPQRQDTNIKAKQYYAKILIKIQIIMKMILMMMVMMKMGVIMMMMMMMMMMLMLMMMLISSCSQCLLCCQLPLCKYKVNPLR